MKLLTVEEFSRLRAPSSGHYELHHGELVLVTAPGHDHKRIERRLRKLLEDMADAAEFVCDTRYAYRPLPESEVWTDVVCICNVALNMTPVLEIAVEAAPWARPHSYAKFQDALTKKKLAHDAACVVR